MRNSSIVNSDMNVGDQNKSAKNCEKWVALVGAPNSGKTTLYNWLTNSKFKTVNYPGATVEYSVGKLAARYGDEKESFSVMDTPGTYSLFPKSLDEEVTLKAIYEHPQFECSPHIILVVDGTQMARHLLVAQQMKEAGFHFVIALTMADLLRKENVQLDLSILENQFSCKVIAIDGVLGSGVNELVTLLRQAPVYTSSQQVKAIGSWSEIVMAEKIQMIESCIKKVLSSKDAVSSEKKISKIYELTAKIDRLLLHPLIGILLFVLIMWGLFSTIYWGASPLMDLVDQGFSALNNLISAQISGLLGDFLANGVVSSFSAVLIFVPQIFILFFGIGLLESSGYLARAATLIDRPFSKLGLSGRSFVPVLSDFACAVPAIMATRNIASKRDRWITNFIIPLMSCSARLPVYALLLGFLFYDQPAWKAGFGLALLYIGSLIVGTLAAAIVNKILQKNDVSLFMMELPMYRRPQWKILIKQSLTRTQNYVKRAGPVIFVFAVLIWAGTTFPNYQADNHEKLQSSYLGQAGQAIEPLFRPMGVDWRVGVGLISAFAAREVFVSSLAVMFNVDGEEDAQREGLIKTMSEATFSTGEKIFTVASVVGLLLFFMIALQCMSTVAIQIKENSTWHLAILQLVVFNVGAYAIAVAVVQGLRSIGVQ